MPKHVSNQDVLQEINEQVIYGISRKWDIIQYKKKERSYQATKRHGGNKYTLNIKYTSSFKKAIWKSVYCRIPTVWHSEKQNKKLWG